MTLVSKSIGEIFEFTVFAPRDAVVITYPKSAIAVFGDLADDPRFTRVYGAILGSLLDQGVRKTLADLDQYREDSP